MVEALRAEYKLREVLPVVGMAKSSCGYARNDRAGGEAQEHAAARKAVAEAFEASGGTYVCRCITVVADVGERTVRGIMAQQRLAARAARKRQRCSSYEGEISEAPPNPLRDERSRHRFHADRPSELRAADAAELRIPAGKACP